MSEESKKTEVNDGGSAFPVPPDVAHTTGDPRDGAYIAHAQVGMSLRDYFAAKAMQGELASQNDNCQYGPKYFDALALSSYQIADAMLKAREGGAS